MQWSQERSQPVRLAITAQEGLPPTCLRLLKKEEAFARRAITVLLGAKIRHLAIVANSVLIKASQSHQGLAKQASTAQEAQLRASLQALGAIFVQLEDTVQLGPVQSRSVLIPATSTSTTKEQTVQMIASAARLERCAQMEKYPPLFVRLDITVTTQESLGPAKLAIAVLKAPMTKYLVNQVATRARPYNQAA